MPDHELHAGAPAGEARENDSLAEIDFDSLQAGDIILLETETGSSYRLSVRGDQDKRLVTLERRSQRDVVGDGETSWESVEPDTLFDLKGSCKRTISGVESGLAPADSTEGHFAVGERAWLGFRLGDNDRTFITSNLETISLISAA